MKLLTLHHRLKTSERYRYTLEEMRELASTGELTADILTDDELAEAMNNDLLPWDVPSCRRLLRAGITR